MEDQDDFSMIIDDCFKILDESVDVLSNIEYSLNSEKEDAIIVNMNQNDLVDMAHEVAESARIKKAEFGFVRRFL